MPPRVGAAVDDDRRARHVGAAVRGPESDDLGDVVGRPEPAERDRVLPVRDALLSVLPQALSVRIVPGATQTARIS